MFHGIHKANSLFVSFQCLLFEVYKTQPPYIPPIPANLTVSRITNSTLPLLSEPMADVVQHFLNPIICGIHVSRCADAVVVKLVQQAQISCGVHPLLPASHGTCNAATPSKPSPDFVGSGIEL